MAISGLSERRIFFGVFGAPGAEGASKGTTTGAIAISFLDSLFFRVLSFFLGRTSASITISGLSERRIFLGASSNISFMTFFWWSFLDSLFFRVFGRTSSTGFSNIWFESNTPTGSPTGTLMDGFGLPLEMAITARPSTRSSGDLYWRPRASKISRSSLIFLPEKLGVNPCSFKEYPLEREYPRITTLNPLLPVK